MGLQMSDRPFTPADVAAGRDLFLGRVRLKNGGAPCISCHTTGGLGALRGGRLGPDLTKVFERYQDRKKLGAWLSAPATPTMLPTFREAPLDTEEILPLVAWFQDQAANHPEDTAPTSLVFVLLGIGGAVGVVLLFDRLWRTRFRGVRKALVRSAALAPGARTSPH
jgi:mono/diheme cytochrome c family protein